MVCSLIQHKCLVFFFKNSLWLKKVSSLAGGWMSAPEISTLRPHCARWPQPAGGASVCAAGGGVCACAGRGETCGWAMQPSEEACPGRGRHRGCRRRRRLRAGRCFRADSRCPPADSWCCSLETKKKKKHVEVCITALSVTLSTPLSKINHWSDTICNFCCWGQNKTHEVYRALCGGPGRAGSWSLCSAAYTCSHCGFCSDQESFTDGRRATCKLMRLKSEFIFTPVYQPDCSSYEQSLPKKIIKCPHV